MTGASRVATAAVTAILLLVVAGCRGDDQQQDQPAAPPSPLATCEELSEPPSGAEPAGAGLLAPEGAALPEVTLPAVTLPCFSGGEEFSLADLRGPAVVNLWASWCPPCRQELPVLQRYADQHAGQVHVLGVVTEDRRSAAVSFAEDAGITFPALDDQGGELLARTDAIALPVTLFVDGAGGIAYLHQGELDEAALVAHVTEQLGVVRP